VASHHQPTHAKMRLLQLLAYLTKQTIDQLAALVKTRLKVLAENYVGLSLD
jgi:hypothetical protein